MAEERHCSECGGELPADAPQGLCPQCLMKLGLPTGAEIDKAAPSDHSSDMPTSGPAPAGFAPPAPAELAEQFPQLEILELLGQGGMGAVYKARQKQLDRLVALKILPPDVSRTEAFAERFTREARSLAKLNHPHIVTVHDFGRTEAGLCYFIMEFVDGTDLRRVIQAAELSPREALAIVPQICEALQYAHDEGIVHRDIKPENVLMDKKGRVKIADFGLAKLLDRPAAVYTLTGAGQKMGTPHYMAPEQIEHPHDVDHRADIYSLGVVFYEMLTGELPLGRFPPPSKKVHIDVRLDQVVLKTLEKEPELRYQQANEVKTAVETICSPAEPGQPGAEAAAGDVKSDRVQEVRQRVWIPAVGLMVAGAINCLGVVAVAIGGMVLLMQSVLSVQISSGFVPKLLIALFVGAQGAVVLVGAWNLMHLRSHSRAVLGVVAAFLPLFPSAVIGLPMAIWALVLLTKKEVKAAFGQEGTAVSIPPKVREFAVSAAGEVKAAFAREKAAFEKLRSQRGGQAKEAESGPSEATAKGRQLGMPVASSILGLIGLVFIASNPTFGIRFSFGFVFIFFSIFLGLMALKRIERYREQVAQTGLAVAGIVLGAMAAMALLGSMF